ncbi:hypothetical protein Tco_0388881 [Tanacetum coccineum]
METHKPLLKDTYGEDVDEHLYRSMIGSLMYLTYSRPNIMFVVCACTRFQVNPKSSHLHVVKRIFRYLKGQPKLGFWYPKDSPFTLVAYTDSDYAGASLDRKSTTRAKLKTINGEVQIQALVDKKKVIVTKTSVRSDLQLEDVEVFLDKQVEGMSKHKNIYVTPSHTKKVFANMKRQGKDFSGRDTPLFPTMIVQAQEQEGEGSIMPIVPQHTYTINQPSISKRQKKQSRRKQRKDTEVSQPSGPTKPMADETENVESLPAHSNDPLLSGEERLKLNELMELCTNLSQRVLDLENTKTSQAAEITKLKERVKKLERRNKSRTLGLKRLRKVGRTGRIESSKDEGLGDQENASKQGRKITDNDADEEEVEVEKVVSTVEVTTANAITTTVDELTLAQTLIEIKAAKPQVVTTAATITTTVVTRPKARGVVIQEPSEFTTTTSPSQPSQLPQAKDKGKEKMVKTKKPLKKKDQILIDEEIAQRLQEELQAELEEEERLARQKEEDANIAEWDNVQAMIDADYELAARLQAQEQEELTIEERSKMFVELMDKRKKHFARLRAEEQRRKPPTKAQKRSQMSTYLKHMAGYKQNQLKSKNYDEIQKLFDKAMTRVNMFVDMDTELVKESSKKAEMVQESSSKRAGEELESDNSKKQKLDENVEAKVDDEAEMKKHMKIVPDDEVAIDAIPLATKPPIISIDREDLETLWKLVKAKHRNTRPEEAYERVLWGNLKVMFEPDVESKVWRNLQGHKVTVWKLFSSSGVHFMRFQNLHIFMMVEKKYPLTPVTITTMLNKKLQADH